MVNSLFAGIFFFSWMVAFVTACTVPNQYVWILVYYCLLAGLSAGISSGSVKVGLFGLLIVVVMALIGRLNWYRRIKAKQILSETKDKWLDDLRDETSRWSDKY